MVNFLLLIWSFFASFLQSGIGFGFPLIFMILLLRLFNYNTAIAFCQMAALVNTIYLSFKYRKAIRIKKLLPLLLPTLLFGLVATIYSFSVKAEYLEILLGLFFIFIALYSLFERERKSAMDFRASAYILGSVSGVLNGFFGIGGPPAVLFLLPRSETKEEYIASMSLYFTISNIVNLIARIILGSLDFSFSLNILTSWIGVGLGICFAGFAFRKINTENLKKIVYLFIMLNGFYMVVKPFINGF